MSTLFSQDLLQLGLFIVFELVIEQLSRISIIQITAFFSLTGIVKIFF